MRFTALAALSGLALVLFACSSESPTSTSRSAGSGANKDDGSDTKSPSSNKTPAPSSSSPGTSSDPTEPAAGGACGSSADQQACFDCCDKAAPGAYEILDQAFGDCVCAADACATACAASACAATPKEPSQGDACDTCLQQKGQACGQKAETACVANATCKKVLDCEDTSKCYDKPEGQ